MEFVLTELADLAGIAGLPGYEQATPDLVSAVLEEAGRLATEVLAPLNQIGDRDGSHAVDGEVRTPEGWKQAYRDLAHLQSVAENSTLTDIQQQTFESMRVLETITLTPVPFSPMR